MVGRRFVARSRQRQAGQAARDRGGHRRQAGEGPDLHPVPRDDHAARRVPPLCLRPPGAGAARRDGGRQATGVGAAVPGRRAGAVFRHLVEGRRRRAESHRGLARRTFRSLVESGSRESGHRPRVPHRPGEERPGAQVRLPRDRRGTDRRAD